MSFRIHATCVSIGGRGVLLRGPSGSGKSDLALRLIDRGASLVSDDTTIVELTGHAAPLLRPVEKFEGVIEVRGLGPCRVRHAAAAPLSLICRLGSRPARLPAPHYRRFGRESVREACVDAQLPSAPILIEMLLNGAALPLD